MARDIFNRIVELGEPLAADATRLIFPGIGDTDMLLQNVTVQYQQNVNRLWEVGSAKTFFVAGRTQGTITAARVIGGKGFSSSFYKQYCDVCNMISNNVSLTVMAGCTDSQSRGSLAIEGVVVTGISYAIAAADMIIHESLSMLFAKLTVSA